MSEIKTEQLDILRVMENIEVCSSQKDLANEVGFSVGKVNYVIKALLEKGFIKAGSFINSHNKQNYKYILTSVGLKNKISLTQRYIKIKKEEYEKLQDILNDDMKKVDL